MITPAMLQDAGISQEQFEAYITSLQDFRRGYYSLAKSIGPTLVPPSKVLSVPIGLVPANWPWKALPPEEFMDAYKGFLSKDPGVLENYEQFLKDYYQKNPDSYLKKYYK